MEKDYLEELFTFMEKTRPKYDYMLKNEQKLKSGPNKTKNLQVEGGLKALDWMSEKLLQVGASIEPCEASAGSPPIILAGLGKSRDKKTILFYGHVLPQCNKADNPLFGAGINGSKGPLICLFTAIEIYKQNNIILPVNLKFFFESMAEKDSDSFRKYLYRNKKHLFDGVDHVTVLDNRTNGFYGTRPILCRSLRGLCRFELSVESGIRALNSGENSGAVHEAMSDIITLLSNLVNSKGDILIPGFCDSVLPLTPQEEKEYSKSSFDVSRFKMIASTHGYLLHKEDKKRILLHTTRFPSISINSIESEPQSKNIMIPPKVTAIFSVHTVPNQTRSKVEELVTDHLGKIMGVLKSSSKITIKMIDSESHWTANPNDSNVQSCLKALKRVYKEDGELVREGGTIPIISELQENSGKDILLLPIGRAKNNSPPASDINLFLDGTKLISTYFYEISK